MRFSLLLFILYHLIKRGSRKNEAFKKYISTTTAGILIKTADRKRGRLIYFDKGKISSRAGGKQAVFDVALVWSDPATAFKVMISQSDEENFKAAAAGKLKVEGMAMYALWFQEGMKLIM